MTPSSGLLMVRIVWMTAILVGMLAIVVGLLSGTDRGDSSRGSSEASFAPGFAFEAQEKAESANSALPRDDRNQRAEGQIPEESRPSSGAPSESAGQPGDASGRTPVVTPQPAPAPRPTPAPRPKPAPVLRPKVTPAPPQIPVSPPPATPAPAQPPVIANNNDGP